MKKISNSCYIKGYRLACYRSSRRILSFMKSPSVPFDFDEENEEEEVIAVAVALRLQLLDPSAFIFSQKTKRKINNYFRKLIIPVSLWNLFSEEVKKYEYIDEFLNVDILNFINFNLIGIHFDTHSRYFTTVIFIIDECSSITFHIRVCKNGFVLNNMFFGTKATMVSYIMDSIDNLIGLSKKASLA